MGKLVNKDVVSDVAYNLINKISSATSWIMTRNTPEKIAINSLIEEIQKSDLSPLVKSGYIYNAKKIIKEYSNQNNIINKALTMLTGEDHTDEISNDWLANYMDKAKLISDEDFQFLWAKILSDEVNSPGSYSLRTLDKLKNLSKKEAEIFKKAASLCLKCGQRSILYSENELLEKHGLSFSDLISLEECGLINLESLTLTLSMDEINQNNVIYNNNIVGIIYSLNGSKESITIGIHVFSQSGRELMQAIGFNEDESYLLDVLKDIKTKNLTNKNIKITAHKINNFEENKVNFNNEIDLLADQDGM